MGIAVAIGAVALAYIIGWRRGYAAGDNPRRRATD